jgi:hypothetical protein
MWPDLGSAGKQEDAVTSQVQSQKYCYGLGTTKGENLTSNRRAHIPTSPARVLAIYREFINHLVKKLFKIKITCTL